MSIELTALTKQYGHHLVVNRVSLKLTSGELFVLLGASGSGKSTILRLIAGLLRPDSGSILMHGRDVTADPPQTRQIGFVFQNYALFRHMSVLENVSFGLRAHKVPASERRARCEALLEIVGLGGMGERLPAQLSGGQRQRVALARALVYRPEVLLLDEPFGALDVKIREQLRTTLSQVQREFKITTILVTHDQDEALQLADRLGVLDRGRLVEVGTPQELYHRPRTETVATFLGGGNVLVGRSIKGQIKLGNVLLDFPPHAPVHHEGSPVRVLFRPEDVVHYPPSQDPPAGTIPLGEGRIKGRLFCGPVVRTRIELHALTGARPVMPQLSYGERATSIEIHEPVDLGAPPCPLDQVRMLALRRFHVLDPTGLKVLGILDGERSSANQPALQLACRLAAANHGSAAILALAKTGSDLAPLRTHLQELLQKLAHDTPARLDSRIRQGPRTEAIVMEAQENNYELVAFPVPADKLSRAGITVRAVLHEAGVPVVLVRQPVSELKSILVCTAAGEPGKADLMVAGRLARHSGASISVLHIARPETTITERKRVEDYLVQALDYLKVLGVPGQAKLLLGDLQSTVLAEGKNGSHQMLVIGASAKTLSPVHKSEDLAALLVQELPIPLVVVPMPRDAWPFAVPW